MTDTRMESALAVIKECFRGDYNLTAENMLARLDENDPGFNKFLFSKIIENSSYTSRHIRSLFPAAAYKSLIEKYLRHSGNKKRIRLISTNLTGEYDRVLGYQWQR